MLLYDVFADIYEQKLSTPLQGAIITSTELAFEMKRAVAHYRCLKTPDQVAAYRQLVTHFAKKMQGQADCLILPTLLDGLAADDSTLDDRQACAILAHLYTVNTQTQANVLHIAAMGKALIDCPRAFAAFLLSLCTRGVTVQQVLASHLLHDYFCYYVSSLGEHHHPLTQLYQLLQAFPATSALAAAAAQVRSEARGFLSYALDGSMGATANELVAIVAEDIPLRFTAERGNLYGLYGIFGSEFIVAALHQKQVHRQHDVWVKFMVDLVNAPEVIAHKLPQILHIIHQQRAGLEYLAELLHAQTLAMLVAEKNANILCLVPFRPDLVEAIQGHDLDKYLNDTRRNASSGLVLISGLLQLLDVTRQVNKSAADIVFAHVLDAVLLESYILEDNKVLRKLRKFPGADHFISRKVQQLEQQLACVIAQQTQGSFALMDYITIEDTWRSVRANIQALQTVGDIKSTCPSDKYQLMVRMAAVFLLQTSPESVFDLQGFSDAIGMQMSCSPTQVTVFERLLIELLGTIDHASLRAQCITWLDAHVTQRSWRSTCYGDKNLYKRAATSGNLGLVRWLEAEKILDEISYDEMAIDAARHNHWPLVSYFHCHKVLKKSTVNTFLQIAAYRGGVEVISMLSSHQHRKLTIKQIEQVFFIALRQNDAQVIRAMQQKFAKPNDAILAKLFTRAVKTNHLAAAMAIAECKRGKELTAAITEATYAAICTQDGVLLRQLIASNSSEFNAVALTYAARKNKLEAVKCFIEHSTYRAPPHLCEKLWQQAKHSNRLCIGMEQYLHALVTPTTVVTELIDLIPESSATPTATPLSTAQTITVTMLTPCPGSATKSETKLLQLSEGALTQLGLFASTPHSAVKSPICLSKTVE